jgi:nucleolar GTP-binding protein
MLSITALAHLRACILYFMDLSEQCGYTVASQVQLFNNIKPLFANKPLVLVINKIDARKLEDLADDDKAMVQQVMDSCIGVVQMSCYTEDGVMQARNFACEKLLAHRVESKLRSAKAENILQKIHVAQPMERDEKVRPLFDS